jgi:hypothetical protein
VVYRNFDLVAPFQPTEDLLDFGLDALFVFTDTVEQTASAHIPRVCLDPASQSLTVTPPSADGLYQLERAASVAGPWVPLGPVTSAPSFSDGGALTNFPAAFYRLRAW